MVCRLKGTGLIGWLYGRLRNGCLWAAFAGGLCGGYLECREYCREQIEVKDAKSGEFRPVTEEDLHGHLELQGGPFDRTTDVEVQNVTTTAPGEQPYFDMSSAIPAITSAYNPAVYEPMSRGPV